MSNTIASERCVLICQSRTCKKQGAAVVLEAFNTIPLDHWTILASPCLGQCGNGPMVLILPDEVWYWRVRADEVIAIAESHLLNGKPIRAMLYPVMHP
jgi:(2Fe-2S) ferredoxin